jgi:hypothetical protein
MNSVIIKPSTRKDKKYMAVFNNNNIVHFGAYGYEDYTIHKDDKRKENYIKRHQVNEDFNNPFSAGSLSRWILWNKKTLKESVKDYGTRFNILTFIEN